MKLEFNDDQRAFLDAVARVAQHHAATPLRPERLQPADALEADLDAAGLFGAMAIETLGPVAACAMVVALSRLPLAAELGLSALVAPWLCPGLPRPFALLDDNPARPARFLPGARTVLRRRVDGQGERLEAAAIGPGDARPVPSIFAYPLGELRAPGSLDWQPLAGEPARLRAAWQVGIAAEIAGSLDAGLHAVLAHVKDRRQFGRPLGAFQAVQHRLAQAAVRIEGSRWLALHAASRLDGPDLAQAGLHAAMAAGHAMDTARSVCNDLHQFMGAMGLTLEHPLHRHTYRARWLVSELGGAARRHAEAASIAWPASTLHPTHEETT